jgi:murein DD-endopeptidase MepM/ murein hydrolase activator NlpD
MRLRPVFPALAVALAVSAAMGPPAAAAPGGGGGGGAAFGQLPPKPVKRATHTGHRFPIAGPFDRGGADARFGARRKGHRHQGQDLAAALGTPVVAPHGGVIEAVGYQRRGAGHYLVLDGEDEDYDYAFMHLRRGSILVQQGDQVRLGQQLGEVGTTGGSSGPHLHFEIWVGGWYAGGKPIDPLPLLQDWAGA